MILLTYFLHQLQMTLLKIFPAASLLAFVSFLGPEELS
jgi:hypothetical protein